MRRQIVIREVPADGVPVLDFVVSQPVPGDAGDIALFQGRLDGRYGVYRPQLFGASFARNVYDQGWHEAHGVGPAHAAPAHAAPANNPCNPAGGCPPRDLMPAGYVGGYAAMPNPGRPQYPTYVGNPTPIPNQTPAAFPLSAPAYSAPDLAPPAPGVATYYPGPGPYTLTGQGCYTQYDCAPDEYCHQGLCMPDPWGGTVVGPGGFASGGLPLDSHVGVTVEGNPHRHDNSNIGPLALGLAASGFGPYLQPHPASVVVEPLKAPAHQLPARPRTMHQTHRALVP